MNEPRLILCEDRAAWRIAIARLAPPELTVREAASLPQCAAELAIAPTSVVVIRVSGTHLAATLQWLRQRPARSCVVCLLERKLAEFEPALREAGATSVVTNLAELSGFEPLVRRHLEQVPPPKTAFAERIMSSLPWSSTSAT